MFLNMRRKSTVIAVPNAGSPSHYASPRGLDFLVLYGRRVRNRQVIETNMQTTMSKTQIINVHFTYYEL